MWGNGRDPAQLPWVEGKPSVESTLEIAEPTRYPFTLQLSAMHVLSGLRSVTLQGAVGRACPSCLQTA